jgi:hypothetical protein
MVLRRVRRPTPAERAHDVARFASRAGAQLAKRGLKAAVEYGGDMVDPDYIDDRLRDYYESAKDSLDDFVDSQLSELHRAIKRRRKKLGL